MTTMETSTINIRRQDDQTHGQYIASDESGAHAGKLTWTMRNGVRDADHTIVAPDMRGKGIAAKLVDALIHDAREEGFKIMPTCSYVAAQFERHPEWADLRA